MTNDYLFEVKEEQLQCNEIEFQKRSHYVSHVREKLLQEPWMKLEDVLAKDLKDWLDEPTDRDVSCYLTDTDVPYFKKALVLKKERARLRQRKEDLEKIPLFD